MLRKSVGAAVGFIPKALKTAIALGIWAAEVTRIKGLSPNFSRRKRAF